MQKWLNCLWADMNRMPGPVWVFSAYAVYNLVRGVNSLMLPVYYVSDWYTVALQLLAFASKTLPLFVVWCLVRRKRYALSLAGWYAGLKLLCWIAVIVWNLVQAESPSRIGSVLSAHILSFVWCGFWFGFMYYLEHDDALASPFPAAERRRAPWWGVVPMAVVILVCG